MAYVSEAVLDAAEAATGERPPPDRAHDVGRVPGPLRHRQARPALRHGARRAVRRVRAAPRSRPSRRRPSRRSSSPTAPPGPASGSTSSPSRPRSRAPPAWPGSGSCKCAEGRRERPRAGRAPRPAPVGAGNSERPGTDEGGTRRPHPDRLGQVRHGLRGAGHAARGDRGAARGPGPASIRVGRRLPHVRRASGPTATRSRRTTRSPCPTPRTCRCWRRTRSPCARRPTTWCSTDGSSGRGVSVSTAGGSRSRCSPRWASAPRRPRPASASCWAPSATGRRRTPGSPSGSTGWWRSWPGEENIREVIAYPKTQSGADLLTGAPTPLPAASLAELGIRVVVPPDPPRRAQDTPP